MCFPFALILPPPAARVKVLSPKMSPKKKHRTATCCPCKWLVCHWCVYVSTHRRLCGVVLSDTAIIGYTKGILPDASPHWTRALLCAVISHGQVDNTKLCLSAFLSYLWSNNNNFACISTSKTTPETLTPSRGESCAFFPVIQNIRTKKTPARPHTDKKKHGPRYVIIVILAIR